MDEEGNGEGYSLCDPERGSRGKIIIPMHHSTTLSSCSPDKCLCESEGIEGSKGVLTQNEEMQEDEESSLPPLRQSLPLTLQESEIHPVSDHTEAEHSSKADQEVTEGTESVDPTDTENMEVTSGNAAPDITSAADDLALTHSWDAVEEV